MFYFHYSLFAHLVVPLLQRHGQGREPVLGGEGLAGARGQQEPHHVVMVLLGRHVQRGEPILGLDIHTRAGIENNVTRRTFTKFRPSEGLPVSEEDLDHLELSGQGADVEGGVPLLGRRVDLSAPGQQVLHYQHVALLARQVQGVQTVLKVEKEF